MKLKFRRVLPTPVFSILSYIYKVVESINYNVQDNSLLLKALSKKNLSKRNYYEVLLNTHILEKGLSNKEFRSGFGREKIKRLSYELNICRNDSGQQNFPYQSAISVLAEYLKKHNNEKEVRSFFENIFSRKVMNDIDFYSNKNEPISGVNLIKRKELEMKVGSFESIAKSRFSLREYDLKKSINPNDLKWAVDIAKLAPSSCNRQPIKAYCVLSEIKILKIMDRHHGIQTKPQGLFIITAEMSAYPNAKTRSLPYVDGGLFMMALSYALQEKFLGNVILNGCLSRKDELEIKKIIDIEETERIIGFMSFGQMDESMLVCKSSRIPLEETLKFVD
ncbi:hypothetical protein RV13_GL003857 [Enterococcus raffinosus]|nr:hypothetical protein RV13_GL003857 [Enterococcus raffinosus]